LTERSMLQYKNYLKSTLQTFLPAYCLYCETQLFEHSVIFCKSCKLLVEKSPDEHSFRYHGVIRHLLIQAKFQPNETYARLLIQYFLQNFLPSEKFSHYDSTTFIPIHWKRRWLREYDFASIFAQKLAQAIQVPCLDLIKAVRFDAPLSLSKTKEERVFKLQKRFKVYKSISPQTILLVDDIQTTGSTLEVVKQLLEQEGHRVETRAFAQTNLNCTV